MKNIHTLFAFGFLVFSCGTPSNNEGTQQASAVDVANTSSGCLYEYSDKLDQLLTKEKVVAALGYSRDDMKSKYTRGSKNVMYHSYSHSWGGGRKVMMDVGSKKVEVPKNDNVSISGMKEIDLETFSFQYRNLTDAEKEDVKKRLEAGIDEKELTDQQKEAAKGLGGAVIEGVKYEDVAGVGTKALWNIGAHNELTVHHVDMMFQLYVDVSDDKNENKEIAILLARALLASCE